MNAEPRRSNNTEFWTRRQGQIVNGVFPLRRLLGCSSYSAVFLTEHKSKGLADAAIKFVRADAALAKALLPQWEAAATLSHPHLVSLFDVGRYAIEGKEFVFVLMEYAEQTLAEILRARPLSVEELWELLIPALDALTFLHRRHLVHGHLKPANILAVNDRLKLTSDTVRPLGHGVGGVFVSSAHDAPEMKAQGASTAGDVWSLGATLVEALTQRVPSSSFDLVLPAGVPASLVETMQRCLSLGAADRPLVIELRSEYKTVPAVEPASAPSPTPAATRPPAPAPAARPPVSAPAPTLATQPSATASAPPPTTVPTPTPVVSQTSAPSQALQPSQLSRPSPVSQPQQPSQISQAVPASQAAQVSRPSQASQASQTQPTKASLPPQALRPPQTAPASQGSQPSQTSWPEQGSQPSQTSQPEQASQHSRGLPPSRAAERDLRVTLAAEEETPTQGFSKRGLLMIVGVALLVLIATWFVLRSPSSEPGEMEHSLVTVPKPKPEPVEETDPARTPETADAPSQLASSTITKPQATAPASTSNSGPGLRSNSTAPNQVARATTQNPPGAVLHEALPTVPDKIRNGIQGRIYVTVRVLVDPEGNVTGALMESPGPSKYFARLADNAAREWQFAPEDGDRSRVWRLTFLFTRDGETVRASEQ